MKYETCSKSELIQKIAALDKELEMLRKEKESYEKLDYPWAGNLGRWVWDVKQNQVSCNPKKFEAIGFKREEVDPYIGYDFFTERLHTEDYARVMENMRAHLYGEIEAYEVEYRIRCKDGSYKWYYDRGVVTKRSTSGQPLVVAGIVFDISTQKEIEEKLRRSAQEDALTGIMNRRAIIVFLEKEMERFKRTQSPFCLMMFDIDHFKRVNDKYGHLVGDEVIQQITKLISNEIRQVDGVGRYGGEEFLVVMTDCTPDSAHILAKRIKDKIQQHRFSNDLQITVSIGISDCSSCTNKDIEEIIREADQKMYVSKANGRNCITT